MLKPAEPNATLTAWITLDTAAATIGTIGKIVPGGFRRYVRILHPMWLAPDVPNLQAVVFPGSSFFGVPGDWKIRTMPNSDGAVPEGATKTTWSEFAELMGVELESTTTFDQLTDAFEGNWPDGILGPAEGLLDEPTLRSLVDVLLRNTSRQPAHFWYPWANTKDYTGRFEVGEVQDVLTFLEMWPEVWATPEYWWPEDRSWLVCSDIDSYESVVACDDLIAAELLAHSDLETLETTLANRLSRGDSSSDL